MNLLKFKLSLLFLIAFACTSIAQEIVVETGKNISSFKYTDSQNNSLDNLQALSNSFMTMGYRTTLYHDIVFASAGFNYMSYNAKGSDDVLHNYMEWNTTYLGIYGGLDVKVFCVKKFKLFLKGTYSPEFLVQGAQTLNNQVYNLVGNDNFKNTIYFLRGGLFINYPISSSANLSLQYLIGQTNNIGTSQEELKINTNQLGFGLHINLKSDKK